MSLQINITYGSGVTSQSAAFQAQFATAANAAVQFYEHTFTNNVAVNISLDYAALGGNAIASNSFGLQGFYTYAQVKSALASHSTSADDATALANLPLADPGNATNGYVLTNTQARILGFSVGATSNDDALTVNSNLTYNFDPNNRNAAGNFDLIGVLEHEISEGVFGRIQDENADSNKSNSALDLFRFTGAGTNTRTYTPNADGWFSLDGTHNLERFNNTSVQTGDLADWYPSISGDSFGNGSTGIASLVTPTDLRVLDAIGWTRAPATVMDFNGNGVSDILFTNAATGDLGFYSMNGSVQGWQHVLGYSTGYTVVGTGDFNHDFASDVLLRNNSTGDIGFYSLSNGATGTGAGNTPGNDAAGTFSGWHDIGGSSTAYSVVGIGDFYGTGTSDILFRNNATGDVGFYEINNGAFVAWHGIGGSSTAYSIVGTADFYGNGTSDILFRNASTGDLGFYSISNGAFAGWHDIGVAGTSYAVVGIGDFYGIASGHGGTSDILLRDATSGNIGFYSVQNGVFTGWHDLGGSSTAYTVVGVGDYYGNGVDDILFRNNTTGDLGFYAMSNGVVTGWHNLGGSSSAYSVVGDTNSNGVAVGEAPTAGAQFSTILGGPTSPGTTGLTETQGGPTTSVTHGSVVLHQTLGGDTIAHAVGLIADVHQTSEAGSQIHVTALDHNLFS